MPFKIFLIIIVGVGLLSSCNLKSDSNQNLQDSTYLFSKQNIPELVDSIYLFSDPIIADGFDFPIGNQNGKGNYTSKSNGKTYNGWYKSVKTGEPYDLGIHTGEDWNGTGGGNTDLGQPVFSIAKGKVLAADDYLPPWGKVILIEHTYLENAKINKIYSLYAHLNEIFVAINDTVERRSKIGTIGNAENSFPSHLHFEIRKQSLKDYAITYWPSSNDKSVEWVLNHYHKPTDFIESHRSLTAPHKAKQILIVFKSRYKLYFVKNGEIDTIYPIALSQNPNGHKVQQGDNKLPEGEYRLIQKAKGPIGGAWGDYFGTGWIRLNYPNNYDAKKGFQNGLISKYEYDQILVANNNKKWPPKTTKLGGGIGIHGWIEDWYDYPVWNLTWGCIGMRNQDLEIFFDRISLQDKILILP